ncbi:type IX secretion system anionic LPS delivery protein PorZ [Hanstruepera marina]|uniref:type IX secretion system anionic LPS delivery protein PorZ n=1 Tax=Hanstruepera marina TaxID=2873265 RepID=UPI001CA6136F|nr:two-component regulator propeller domain-containing protein [Hanstruepera marina]
MIKKICILLILLLPCLGFSQDFSNFWEGHFSYLNIKDVSQGNGKLYAAAENAVFIYDPVTLEMETLSTINGLSGETISQIYYSELYETLVIGYENGLMDLVFDNDDDVLTVIDILEKPTIPPTNKRINHFNEYNGYIYISTDYGISVYDLARLEFGDTYFIGNGGAQIRITQTTIFNEFIYASCLDNNGVKRALVASSDLVDFNEWDNVRAGNFLAIESLNDKLFALRFDRRLFEINNTNFIELTRFDTRPNDVRSVQNFLLIILIDRVFVYDSNFALISEIIIDSTYDTELLNATIIGDYMYIGTNNHGILKVEYLNPIEFEITHPSGPLLNDSFSIKALQNNLWLTYGDYSLTFHPSPLQSRGLSHLQGETWVNIPFDSVLGAKNLNKIAINPFNLNQIFVSSFQDGLLEVNNDSPTILYNEDNSGLESLVVPSNPNFKSIRQCASNFDRNGILWTMTGRVDRPLKSYDPSTGQWQGYDFTSLIQDGLSGEWGYDEVVIDNNGTKWIGGYNYGLIGFNETNSGTQLKSINSEEDNMPSSFVTALALDRRNQIWLGTPNGLRVLYNTSNFFNDDVNVESIIILEEGVPKELLFQQFVSDIEVDGSNNKWVATIGSGIFYFSSDGQETIYHFTKDNSPLPSNNIVDVSIDDASGEVYIATDKGLVSYRAGGSEPQDNFESAFIYPNPVRPNFNIIEEKVKINGLSDNVNVKILDIEGNLVAEATSNTNLRYRGYNLEIDGGTAFWNGKNLYNNVVSSGVYLVMLYDLDTFETKVLKVMVVR